MSAAAPLLLRGNQTPRVFTAPAYAHSAGPEVIDMAAMAGLILDPWQGQYLTAGLGETADGSWAALEVAENVPRQNGKNSGLEARQLGGLFLFEEGLQIHTAHREATAVEQFLRVVELIEGTPEFSRRCKKPKRGKGSEEIELHRDPKTGRAPRLRFRTRSSGSARGFSCDTIYFDESAYLPQSFHGELMPVLSARPHPQLWYATSAIDEEEHEHGIVFTRLRIRGLAGGEGLVYLEFSLPIDSPDDVTLEMAMDPENWLAVNPAAGNRIDLDFIAGEQRSMSARAFAVERLNVGAYPDVSDDAGRVITKEQWAAIGCKDESQGIISDRCFGLDMNPDRTRATIGSAGRRPDDLWQMAVVEHGRRTDWIVDRCVELYAEFRAPFVVDTKGPAANLIADLKNAGVEVIEADTGDYGVATSNFYDFVVNGGVRYPQPQPELSDAINDARKQKMGDAWKWSRLNSTSADITPLVACTLALWGATTREPDYATVIIAEDDEEPMEFGAQKPEVLSQADVTTCFACRTGGGCAVHNQEGDG